MKKTLIAGMASLALAVVPVASVFADASTYTDTVQVTVSDGCTSASSFTRAAYSSGGVTNNTSHKNGTDGTWSTTANTDTLSATRSNGTVTYALGSSQFKVICNNAGGYKVTVATTSLTGPTGTTAIPNNSTFSASVSGWAPMSAASSSATKYTNGSTVKTESTTTAGTTFEVFYGVGISATQAAGTYTGTATYSLTKL